MTIGRDGRRFALKENHLYGSARLGVDNRDTALYDNTKSGASRVWNPFYPQGTDGGWFDLQQGSEEPPFVAEIGEISSFTRGLKAYEISNHLGNVLVTVSDKKFGFGASGGDGILIMSSTDENSYFQPEILSAQDYYAYGATKPGRRGSLKKNAEGNIAFVFDEAADANNWRPLHDYRYAFNGKETDKKIWSEERVAYDYGFRVLDGPRFISVDPLTRSYPHYSPYQFAGNNPIANSDLDGLEEEPQYLAKYYGKTIDMRGAPPSSKKNAAGYPRNNEWFWKQMVKEHPQMFDESNAYLAKKGISPIVNDQWIEHNEHHASHKGQKLVHHHIKQGEFATGVPEDFHQQNHKALHPNRGVRSKLPSLGTVGKVVLVFGVGMSIGNIATAKNPGETAVEEATSWSVGLTGAALGGLVGGPVGSVFGGLGFGLLHHLENSQANGPGKGIERDEDGHFKTEQDAYGRIGGPPVERRFEKKTLPQFKQGK